MKHLKYTLALLLCSSILAQTPAPQAQAISISEAFATPAPSSSSSRSSTINEATGKGKGVSYTIAGQTYRYTGESINVVYESKALNLTRTPAVTINGTVMVPLKEAFAKQGIKVSYHYYKKIKKIKVTKNNKIVIMHLGDTTMTVNQKNSTLPQAPISVTYGKSKIKTILVPFREIVKALGINYLWDKDLGVAQLSKPVLNFVGKHYFTPYNWSLNTYASIQKSRVGRASLAEFKRLVNYKKDTTYGFQYLRLDQYREVDEKKFISTFNYFIKDSCENNGSSPTRSVLYGKGDVMLAAAKKEGIDPMYFAAQTFIESAYGRSSLARGNRITKVALPSYARRGGKFITKNIKKECQSLQPLWNKSIRQRPTCGCDIVCLLSGLDFRGQSHLRSRQIYP